MARFCNESRPMVKNQWDADGLTVHCTDAGSAGMFICVTVTEPILKTTHRTTTARQMYDAIAALLADKRAVLVHERAFASVAYANELMMARRQAFSAHGIDPDTPLSVIQGQPTWGEGIAGALLHAMPASVAQVETLRIHATPVGRSWSTATNDYLVLQLDGMTGQASSADAHGLRLQADSLFDMTATLLAERGFAFSNVARTWFYIRDILQHYRTFNAVRDNTYARFGLMPKPPAPIWLPASTAIRGAPTNGAALIGDILAVKAANQIPVERLSNPGQKEAFDYGAAFARAALIQERDVDVIQVSGTASIGEDGTTLYPDDGAAQIACTLDKLEALLATASARLDHVVTANVFVKDAALIKLFHTIAKQRGLCNFPGVPVVADVCRDDLLFEIDAEVVVPKSATAIKQKEALAAVSGGDAR